MLINHITAERILAPTGINIASHVINPFRGCGFGCRYCYGRQNKNVRNRQEPWGEFVDLKTNCTELLIRELATIKPVRVLIGSTTDPYQPAEKDYRLTRAVLGILNQERIPVTILTRSTLLTRDLDLLKLNPEHTVYFSVNQYAPDISSRIEPGAPSFSQRLNLIRTLVRNNIRVVAYVSPFIPFFTDFEGIYRELRKLPITIKVELYNPAMGSFREIYDELKILCRRPLLKLMDLFATRETYCAYGDELTREFRDLDPNISLFIPAYDTYYQPGEFNYE